MKREDREKLHITMVALLRPDNDIKKGDLIRYIGDGKGKRCKECDGTGEDGFLFRRLGRVTKVTEHEVDVVFRRKVADRTWKRYLALEEFAVKNLSQFADVRKRVAWLYSWPLCTNCVKLVQLRKQDLP